MQLKDVKEIVGAALVVVIFLAGCGGSEPSSGSTNGTETSAGDLKSSDRYTKPSGESESASDASGMQQAVAKLEEAFEESKVSPDSAISMIESGNYDAARLTLRQIQSPELSAEQQQAIKAVLREIERQ